MERPPAACRRAAAGAPSRRGSVARANASHRPQGEWKRGAIVPTDPADRLVARGVHREDDCCHRLRFTAARDLTREQPDEHNPACMDGEVHQVVGHGAIPEERLHDCPRHHGGGAPEVSGDLHRRVADGGVEGGAKVVAVRHGGHGVEIDVVVAEEP
jgi:hypothetical protein